MVGDAKNGQFVEYFVKVLAVAHKRFGVKKIHDVKLSCKNKETYLDGHVILPVEGSVHKDLAADDEEIVVH